MAGVMIIDGVVVKQQIEMEEEELIAILATLPKCKATWSQPPVFYQYKGVWLPANMIPSVIWVDHHFAPKPSDHLLVTSMKVGTTWLKALAFVVTQRHRHRLDDPHHPLLTQISHDLVPMLEFNGIQHVKDHQSETDDKSSNVFHTHLHYSVVGDALKRSNCRVVYLCRNLGDTFVSMWKFFAKVHGSQDYIPMEEAFEMFCNGVSVYGPIWDHVMGYWNASKERPDQFLFMSYEELHNDQNQQVKKLAEFLGFPFSDEEDGAGTVEKVIKLCSFENLSKLEVNKNGKFAGAVANQSFYREGKVGDSTNYLNTEMVHRLNAIVEVKFKGCVLKPFLMAKE